MPPPHYLIRESCQEGRNNNDWRFSNGHRVLKVFIIGTPTRPTPQTMGECSQNMLKGRANQREGRTNILTFSVDPDVQPLHPSSPIRLRTDSF